MEEGRKNRMQTETNEPIIQRRCVKCGRILAQSNRKNKCEVCRDNLKQTVLKWFCVGVFISACILILAFFYDYDKKHPVTYESAIVTIVDKDKYSSLAGKVIITRYFFIFDDGNKVRVSGETYKNHEIGDSYYIYYKIRDEKVIGISLDENNNFAQEEE